MRVAADRTWRATIVSWTVEVRRGGEEIARSTHSTWDGLLLPREELAANMQSLG